MSRNKSGLRFSGMVVSGQQKGRTIGFPTANLDYYEDGMETGVFGVLAEWQGKCYSGIMNIGFRPTFNESWKPVVEVHLFGFGEMIYGECLQVETVFKIREEKKFSSVEALVKRIGEDVEYALQEFEKMGI